MEFYISQAGTKRLLKGEGIAATKIISLAEASKSSVRVTYRVDGKGKCSTIFKKLDFWIDYQEFRRKGSQELTAQEITPGRFAVPSSGGRDFYRVTVLEKSIPCSCKDYEQQFRFLKERAVCKHGYAVLRQLGHDSLEEMIAGNQVERQLELPLELAAA